MSEMSAEKCVSAVRLRVPERRQMEWVAQCPDDLVCADHGVRLVAAEVEKLDLSGFEESIRARAGVAGRDTTDPRLLVGFWLCACIRGIGSARELARRCEESAPFRWLCGGVTVNHRLLSDFRTGHGAALDALFTQVIASVVDKQVVHVSRVSQDGVRVRVGAGASSFRREERLEQLLEEARQHVDQLRGQVDSPEYAALSARQRGARKRAAAEKLGRLEQAMAQLPELKQKQADAARRAGHGQGVELFVPPKPARSPGNRGRELEPKRGDTEAVLRWKQRLAGEEGKEIYKQRAATSETINADLRTYRGLTQMTVRGLAKARCVALWCALAYNLMHFATALLS